MNLILADGRKRFYQWDTGLYLIVDGLPVGGELHYDMPDVTDPVSYKIHEKDGKTVCKVPDKLLQHAGKFTVWAYIRDELGNRTVYKKSFVVEGREKLPDYISTDDDVGGSSGGTYFEIGDNMELDSNGVLKVKVASKVEADNTLPVSSAAVHTHIGNIEALLDTI